MRFRPLGSLLVVLFGVSGAFADGMAPDYVGDFTIAYYPIMCLVPPCPPGNYHVEMGEHGVAQGDSVIVDRDGQRTQYQGQYLDFDKVTGEVWIGGAGKVHGAGNTLADGVLLLRLDHP